MSHDDRIAEIEKQKYEQVWDHDEYRKFSPGEQEQSRFLNVMKQDGGDSVIDWGCGEGHSVQFFQDNGLSAWGIEHASNAVRAAGIQVLEECLWEVPEGFTSEYAFCCDVMEHIPTMKVNLVLSKIAAATEKVSLFRISTVEDHFGPNLIHKPLHLTVKDADWWKATLERHFEQVELWEARSTYAVFICAAIPFQQDASGNKH